MEGSSPSHLTCPNEQPSNTENEALPKQSEEQGQSGVSLIGSNWPSLPTDTGSPIQPGQATKVMSQQASPWKIKQRAPEEYEKDRVGKYVEYFKGNKILSIPEILQRLEPRIVSLVVSDIKTRRLVGLKKESFEDLLRKTGVPCQYFCRRNFATWDVLLPSAEQDEKVASSNIMTKFFRLQPEYLGTHRIRVTICNVPASITGEVLATFLSAFGCVEEINLLWSAAGMAYRDYVFQLCLTQEGFQAIPEIIISRERQMMVFVEGRRPHCWSCKQLGHISKFCPGKNPPNAAAATATTETAATTASTATISSETKGTGKETENVQLKKNTEWTEVTWKKKKSPRKVEDEPETASTAKNTPAITPIFMPKSVTAPIPAHITEHPFLTTTKAKKKAKAKPVTSEETPMETVSNLKRSSGEGAAKKMCSGPSDLADPLEGSSNAFPQRQPQQIPLQSSLPLTPLPPPPQYRSPQHAPPEKQCSQPLLPPQPSQPPPPVFHHPSHSTKTHPHQILHTARALSLERPTQKNLLRTLSLPSLSPLSSPELFPDLTQEDPEPAATDPAAELAPRSSRWQAKAVNCDNQEPTEDQCRKAMALCTVGLESVTDYQLRKSLKPLLDFDRVNRKRICNPVNFRSAAMVTTFIHSAGDRTKGVWQFLDTVCQTNAGVKLAELEHSSLKRWLPFCSGRVPILVHPSLYRALKVRFPLDVGRVSRGGRVNAELGTGSLKQAVGILTPEDFRPFINTE